MMAHACTCSPFFNAFVHVLGSLSGINCTFWPNCSLKLVSPHFFYCTQFFFDVHHLTWHHLLMIHLSMYEGAAHKRSSFFVLDHL